MKNWVFGWLLMCGMWASAQVDRVEPPFWYEGMQRPVLELMLYGPQLAEYELEPTKKLKILEIKKTENPNYLFVSIDTRKVKAGIYQFRLKKAGSASVTVDYEFKKREKGSATRKSFDASDVIYLLMPDRFANGDPDNDQTDNTLEKPDRSRPGGRHGGDLQGIIDHLDYLQELGVTTVWSTPLLEDNEPVYSYHTYAQSDYYKIDPRYGRNEDYRRLADELHARDMKLVMDYVTNHWGISHWMIQDLPTKDWINSWNNGDNGFKRSSYRMTTQFDPHASQVDKADCMDGWFDTTMPDINQRNPLVLTYLIQNALWWIEYAGLDGFRVDTYSYNDKEAIAQWTKAITDEYPQFNIAGEVWMHDQAQMAYWQKDSKVGAIDHYNSHLPTVMDFTLHNAISIMFKEHEQGWDKGMLRAYENFVNDFLYPDINNILVFAGNHDTNRINEIYDGDLATYKMVMTLIATVRGIPQIYYGDELGMRGNKDTHGDGDIRRDFPGGWAEDETNAFTAQGRSEKQSQFFEFTKKLFNWRKSASVVHQGKTMQYVPENNVYVYFRYDATRSVMVVINNSLEDQQLDLSRFSERLTATQGYDVLTGKELELHNTLSIMAKTSMIIELK